MPVVFNAANEFAVAEFLDRRAGYLEITDMIAEAMAHHTRISHPSLEQVLEAEQETYESCADGRKRINFRYNRRDRRDTGTGCLKCDSFIP